MYSSYGFTVMNNPRAISYLLYEYDGLQLHPYKLVCFGHEMGYYAEVSDDELYIAIRGIPPYA